VSLIEHRTLELSPEKSPGEYIKTPVSCAFRASEGLPVGLSRFHGDLYTRCVVATIESVDMARISSAHMSSITKDKRFPDHLERPIHHRIEEENFRSMPLTSSTSCRPTCDAMLRSPELRVVPWCTTTDCSPYH
jgi:hypothetical protein